MDRRPRMHFARTPNRLSLRWFYCARALRAALTYGVVAVGPAFDVNLLVFHASPFRARGAQPPSKHSQPPGRTPVRICRPLPCPILRAQLPSRPGTGIKQLDQHSGRRFLRIAMIQRLRTVTASLSARRSRVLLVEGRCSPVDTIGFSVFARSARLVAFIRGMVRGSRA